MAYNRATGKIIRLYPDQNGCYIELDYTPPQGESKPRDKYFHLEKTHENYNSLYSLILVAAVNGYDMMIRVGGSIVEAEYAKVSYLVVNW